MPLDLDVRLQLGILSHQVALERWTVAEVRRLLAVLEANERDLIRRLESPALLTAWRRRRLRALLAEVRIQIELGNARLGDEIRTGARALAVHEAEFGRRLLAGMLGQPARVVGSVALSPALLRSVVEELPLVGATLSRELSALAQARFRRIRAELRLGLTQGETTAEIVKRIVVAKKLGRAQAEALVRTAANHVSTRSRDLLYRENDDVIGGVEWVSTLDGRTTPTCRALDGRRFPVDSGPRPPAHFRCRSTVVPVTKSWEELGLGGLGLPELSEMMRPYVRDVRPVRKIPRGQRRIGQVRGEVNYSAWMRAQDPAFQDQVLGPARGALWRRNPAWTMETFLRAGSPFEELTLAELYRIDGQIVDRLAPGS